MGGHNEGEEPALPVTLADVRAAHKRIAPYVMRTPVLTCSTIDALVDPTGRTQLFFKCEMFQKGGSFKARGATNAVMGLSDEEAARGVVAHSSGNHAQGVSFAARARGIPAHIVMPKDAPPVKIDAVRGYGGKVTLCEPTLDSRLSTMSAIQKETGAIPILPFDAKPTIAGQGTIALELLEQVQALEAEEGATGDGPPLDAIVAPISGGGMTSGIAIAAKGVHPGVRIVAAEPHGANDAADVVASLAAGRVVPTPKVRTLSDGLQASMGVLNWQIVSSEVDAAVGVTEAQTIDAMRLLFERMKVVVEPSGAVPLAAVLKEAARKEGKEGKEGGALEGCRRIGVVLSGGNVDLASVGFWEAWHARAEAL